MNEYPIVANRDASASARKFHTSLRKIIERVISLLRLLLAGVCGIFGLYEARCSNRWNNRARQE